MTEVTRVKDSLLKRFHCYNLHMESKAYDIALFGVIQGVGFRPFVYTLAQSMCINGYVQNRYDRLFIHIEVQNQKSLKSFMNALLHHSPPNAIITHHHIAKSRVLGSNGFSIYPSSVADSITPTHLPLDTRLCEDCLNDMRTQGRFFQYAFTTCTHCGPRYSIINALPYDRIHTSMRDFTLCEVCKRDYANPLNRRFHAQPISCHKCAIRIRLIDKNGQIYTHTDSKDDIKLIVQVAQAIKNGQIVAIKGIGGFNLIADASNIESIATLRARKNRPHKPFALMFGDMASIESLAFVSSLERAALLSPQAPIVLLNRHYKNGGILSEEALSLIAPSVRTLGAILPYNGILHLLFGYLSKPIIFTSANCSNEPLISNAEEVLEKLCYAHNVVDMILDYDRAIINALDDSIVRLIAGEMRILRLARGYAPYALPILSSSFESASPSSAQKMVNSAKNGIIIGVGAQQKLSVSVVDSTSYALISPYIGDLESVDSIKRYEDTFDFFKHLYKQDICAMIYDMHPRYVTTQKAIDSHENIYALAHHKAHFYALLAETRMLNSTGLGIIWDGTGLGEDGHIWGGECFFYEPYSDMKADSMADSVKLDSKLDCIAHKLDIYSKNTRDSMYRICHFSPFVLLGGESSIRDIGKLALSLLWHCGINIADVAKKSAKPLTHFSPKEIGLLEQMYHSDIYPRTSSIGRIIDAVAYMLGLLEFQSYEGQSGALLESYAYADKSHREPYRFYIRNNVIYYDETIKEILNDRDNPQKAAHRFLETLAHIALTLAQQYRRESSVYFSGGVFQNKFLCDRIHTLFSDNHIPFFMHHKLPCNDTNISFGQAVFGVIISHTLET